MHDIFFFFKFSPKIACQAQKPPKPLKKQELALAFSYPQLAILKTVEKNKYPNLG
jgi:hypothetical protein